MRFDTSDIAQAIQDIRVCNDPIDPDLLPPIACIVGELRRRKQRLRTAVGTTPPALRPPELSDGVPIETDELAWLDNIEL